METRTNENKETQNKVSTKIIKCDNSIFHISALPSGCIALMPSGENQLQIWDRLNWKKVKEVPYPEKIDGFNPEQNGMYHHISLHEVTVFNPFKLNFNFRIPSTSGTNFIMKPVMLNEREFVCFYSTMKRSSLRIYDFDKGPTPLLIFGPYQINQSAITQITPDSFAVCTPTETRFFTKKEGRFVNTATNIENAIKANMTALTRLSDKCIIKLLYCQENIVEKDEKSKTLPKGKCSIQIWENQEEKWNCTSMTTGDMPYWPDHFQISPDGTTLIGIISTNNDKKIWAWDIITKKARTYHFENLMIDFETLLLLPNGTALYAKKNDSSKLVVFTQFVSGLQKNMQTVSPTSGLFKAGEQEPIKEIDKSLVANKHP